MKAKFPATVWLPQVRIDFSAKELPDHAVKLLSMACADLVENILQQPGGRELLDAETARRKAREEAGGERKRTTPA